MPDIGPSLREARMRARIDISEIESETKIRAKYLRALENEEWDLLPGPTYVKSFLRTYADALGLDGKLLIEEYKLRHERLSDVELQPITPLGQRDRRPPRAGVPRGRLVATGQVYVCLKAAGKRTLVNSVLTGGARTSTFRSSRFRVRFGTSEARLVVNGKSHAVPPAANGIGYEITPTKIRRLQKPS